jgi:hypothetical protein
MNRLLLRDKQDEKLFLSSLPRYNPSRDILRGLVGKPAPEDHRIIQVVGAATASSPRRRQERLREQRRGSPKQ